MIVVSQVFIITKNMNSYFFLKQEISKYRIKLILKTRLKKIMFLNFLKYAIYVLK